MKTMQKGFTLVEIAIVLVIIGLLLGGILKGQEMITQAKIKNVMADMSGVSAAMYGYHDRYKALPGDDPKANRWTGVTVPTSAGNGVIEGTYADTTVTNESMMFWNHLRLAGFVSGTGATNPFNAVSGKMGVQTGDGSGPTPAGVLGETATTKHFTGLIMCSANLPDKIAISVDAQMDDGDGTKGSIRAQKQGAAGPNPPLTSAGAADAYTEDGVSSYVVCRQM
jgi:prepilin-type N-terminal cleavage/methylation domain-containing protein